MIKTNWMMIMLMRYKQFGDKTFNLNKVIRHGQDNKKWRECKMIIIRVNIYSLIFGSTPKIQNRVSIPVKHIIS